MGISTTVMDRDIRPNLGPDAVKKVGRRWYLYGPAVVRHRFDRWAAREAGAAQHRGREDGDPMLDGDGDGGPSDALERYRDEKAKMARLQRLVMEGELVEVGQLRDALGRMAAVLRTAGEQLRRQYDEQACRIVDDALASWEKQVQASFGDVGDEQDAA